MILGLVSILSLEHLLSDDLQKRLALILAKQLNKTIVLVITLEAIRPLSEPL